MIISGAIYSILNVSAVNSLVNDISPVIADPNINAPYIIINETGDTENFKGGYKIVNYDLQIDIYAPKGKNNAGGFLTTSNIAVEVERLLNRYNGTVAGVNIDTIYLVSKELIFDEDSQNARIMMDYSVRVNEVPPI